MLSRNDFLEEDRGFLKHALGGYASWFGFNGEGPLTNLVQSTTASGSALLLTDRDTLSAGFPDAFLFPVRWEQRSAHHPHLPPGVCAQADMVLRAYGKTAQDWKLAPLNPQLAGVNLSEMPIGGNSGCASLAASLFVALRKTAITPAVFATAGWEHGQLRPVKGLETKVPLLAGLSTTSSPVLFVHPSNKDQASALSLGKVTVRKFPPVSTKAAQSLVSQIAVMLQALGQLPSVATGASLKERIDAFNAEAWPSDVERFDYYDREIAAEYIQELRGGKTYGGDVFLLLYNPGNPGLVRVMLGLVGAKRAVVLRQKQRDSTTDANEVQGAIGLIESLGVAVSEDDIVSLYTDISPQDAQLEVDRITAKLARHGRCLYVDAQSATSLLRALSLTVAGRLKATPLCLEQYWRDRKLLSATDAIIQDLSFVWR